MCIPSRQRILRQLVHHEEIPKNNYFCHVVKDNIMFLNVSPKYFKVSMQKSASARTRVTNINKHKIFNRDKTTIYGGHMRKTV